MSNLKALLGHVIFAWCPESSSPKLPGSKFRPVLVVDVDTKNNLLRIAYGTSQNVHNRHRGQITFAANEIPGLVLDTKFSLATTLWIPVKAEYFSQSRTSLSLKILGPIPSTRLDDMYYALDEVSLI